MNDVFEEGKRSISILSNPYWKDYPNNPDSEDAVKGRVWVDGWVQGIRENVRRVIVAP